MPLLSVGSRAGADPRTHVLDAPRADSSSARRPGRDLIDALRALEERGARVFDVREEAEACYDEALQPSMENTVTAEMSPTVSALMIAPSITRETYRHPRWAA
jgi:hypothetical protein